MTKRTNYVGPCATACKPGAGTDAQNGTFDYICCGRGACRTRGRAPGRADRMIACRSCGAPTASSDGICRDCADAMRAERSEALSALCRVHRVRYVEDLPVSALEEMQAEWGRC
jgi:hypothetical protein